MLDLTPQIEAELRRQVARLDHPITAEFHQMLTYHMGWSGQGAGLDATGKLIRPQLLCLSFLASGTSLPLEAALPAAAAVELVHNFSLAHDDIEDNSPIRRGRPALWGKWGIPMAINAGDALFVLANQAILDLSKHHSPAVTLEAARILHSTCLNLTCGQFLDMSFEDRLDVPLTDYQEMIAGKTAALLQACCSIGSLLGGASQETRRAYASFGYALGMAFQVQDDILGVWGNEGFTGKSAVSDLVEGKKSLPVLYGLKEGRGFADRWKKGPIKPEEVRELAQMLKDDGAFDYAHIESRRWTALATESLEEASPKGDAAPALSGLLQKLLYRER